MYEGMNYEDVIKTMHEQQEEAKREGLTFLATGKERFEIPKLVSASESYTITEWFWVHVAPDGSVLAWDEGDKEIPGSNATVSRKTYRAARDKWLDQQARRAEVEERFRDCPDAYWQWDSVEEFLEYDPVYKMAGSK